MKWKRLRKVVAGQPKEEVYENKKRILKALQKLSEQGSLDLRYLDETGWELNLTLFTGSFFDDAIASSAHSPSLILP